MMCFQVLGSFDIMDYSLLLAVHNITEEMRTTLRLPPLSTLELGEVPRIDESIPPDLTSNNSLNIHEKTTSTNSCIARTKLSNLPTYIQYLRVIEFIRAQQESSRTNTKQSSSNKHIDNFEVASVKTVKEESSPILGIPTESTHHLNDELSNSSNVVFRANREKTTDTSSRSSPFQLTKSLIGGDIWYNRQNLSRLAMYVFCFNSN